MIHNITLESDDKQRTYLVWDDVAGTLSGEGAYFDAAQSYFNSPPGIIGGAQAAFVIQDPRHDKEDFMSLLCVVADCRGFVDISDGLKGIAPKVDDSEGVDSQEALNSGLFGELIH